ncbi:glycosyltransferase [Paenibacillus sp. N1-5-1-14]|uniref:glycosyltransferase family 4 protein n=1 Tax=Paenibacillus radicibacter TaxID=2972488 RepID=UPI002158DF50|nr:glycosyltransferase [Paenibacillus radicibacter]MCR8645189.1 glycosyltransferase [Paenibacillus radicibacter]
MDTLNRHRCTALRKAGYNPHILYFQSGSGVQNITSDAPTFITNDDAEISRIIYAGNYEAIVLTSDYVSLPRFRNLGYRGKLIFEIQGYGPIETAREELTRAIPYICQYANAIVHPRTPHIQTILKELYPVMPVYQFNNAFDGSTMSYKATPKPTQPVIAWIGRIMDNKNWLEFLQIGSFMAEHYFPNLQMVMYEDHTLAYATERASFEVCLDALHVRSRLSILSNVPSTQMPYVYSMVGDSGGILCSTSKVEGAPHSVVEAMNCRCPVLSSNKDGVHSAVIHNVTGKFYTLGNISEAAIQGYELMSNLPLRKRIIENAEAHVKLHFSLENYVNHFRKMLSEIHI